MNRGTVTKIGAICIVALVAFSTSACSTRAPADEIILYYKAGIGDNKTFQECIYPGKAGSYPIDDEIYSLPTSQRTWNIRPNDGDTSTPISSGSKPSSDGQPGPEVAVYATADFFINTDCSAGKDSPVVKFWENSGRRYGIAKDDEGFQEKNWRKLLMNTFVPAEERAIREQTMKYLADDLDANLNGAWGKIGIALESSFMTELNSKLGGQFFCGSGYNGGKKTSWTEQSVNEDGIVETKKVEGTCPPIKIAISNINFADSGIAEARNKVYKAKSEAEAQLIAARAEVDKAAMLSKAARDSAYLELKKIEAQLQAAEACASNPNCTIVIGGDGVIAGK